MADRRWITLLVKLPDGLVWQTGDQLGQPASAANGLLQHSPAILAKGKEIHIVVVVVAHLVQPVVELQARPKTGLANQVIVPVAIVVVHVHLEQSAAADAERDCPCQAQLGVEGMSQVQRGGDIRQTDLFMQE